MAVAIRARSCATQATRPMCTRSRFRRSRAGATTARSSGSRLPRPSSRERNRREWCRASDNKASVLSRRSASRVVVLARDRGNGATTALGNGVQAVVDIGAPPWPKASPCRTPARDDDQIDRAGARWGGDLRENRDLLLEAAPALEPAADVPAGREQDAKHVASAWPCLRASPRPCRRGEPWRPERGTALWARGPESWARLWPWPRGRPGRPAPDLRQARRVAVRVSRAAPRRRSRRCAPRA